jgi:hypothetical protein
MGDRELLEWAAKAAGIEIEWGIIEEGRVIELPTRAFYRDKYGIRWSWLPLDNNDQALTIAMRCGMILDMRYAKPEIAQYNRVEYWHHGEPGNVRVIPLGVHHDPEQALRSCIFRAAVEIGKAMAPSTDGGGT